jgi:chloramphenicol O-acetyltransferase type A
MAGPAMIHQSYVFSDVMSEFFWPVARPIDLNTFARRKSYEFFIEFDNPTATGTVNLDLTLFMQYVKDNSLHFAASFGFLLSRAVNHIPEFRCRMQDGIPVEFEHVIPLFVVLRDDKCLEYAKGVFSDEFSSDYAANQSLIERVRHGFVQEVGKGNHGLFWFTNNPWNRFTALQFPFSPEIADIPVFGVGKISNDLGRRVAPLAFRINHAFVDGYHVAQFFDVLETHLAEPTLLELPFKIDIDSGD